MSHDALPFLLNTKQAARFLAISRSTLEKWRFYRSSDGPPVVKIGRAIRYSRADLEAWVSAHRTTVRGQSNQHS